MVGNRGRDGVGTVGRRWFEVVAEVVDVGVDLELTSAVVEKVLGPQIVLWVVLVALQVRYSMSQVGVVPQFG